MLRLHEVVRISCKEALSKLGVWRLDHLLAIRHLSNRDMSAEIAEDAARCGTLVEDGDEWIEKLDAIALAAGYNRTLRAREISSRSSRSSTRRARTFS